MNLNLYEQQLIQVNQALSNCKEDAEKNELLVLKGNIEELLSLAKEDASPEENSNTADPMSDEFALFMAEMEKEGALERSSTETSNQEPKKDNVVLKEIEGMRCKAPHKHKWGQIAYHNAMICSVVENTDENSDKVMVRVLFTHPTHQEMLPCPYYYDSDCKFSEDKCRFSHGETVLYSSVQEYIEPKFEDLQTGSHVLAKQKSNLWSRAKITKILDDKLFVRFDSEKKEAEIEKGSVFPLENGIDCESDNLGSGESDIENRDEEDIINMSLLIKPSDQALGDWEKYTKGIGSKLMMKMGYITGTGLGKNAEGRVDPVTAVILPQGKSLDHCMNLRERAGGDRDLFSVERKLKRQKRKQEIKNQKAYERQSKDNNVFNFINNTLSGSSKEEKAGNTSFYEDLKSKSSRMLNVSSLEIESKIKEYEKDVVEMRERLGRSKDFASKDYKVLKDKLLHRQDLLKNYKYQASMINTEQSMRKDIKKMTVF